MDESGLKQFIRYISLSILGMIGISCYILADTFFISRALGPSGIAALNLSISVYSVIHGLGLMLAIGGASKYSILKSKKEDEEADKVFTICFKSSFIIGMIFAIIGFFFSRPLGCLLGANHETLGMTESYLKTILFFAVFFLLNNIMISFVRNDNNPKLSMIAMLTGSLSNILLDYIFMFPLKMGMFGAAFATCLAPVISLGVLSIHFIRKNNGFHYIRYIFQISCLIDISALGLSAFINEISSAVVLIIFNLVILNLEGNIGLASYGIVANIALVGLAIFTGLAQGIQPIISQAYGLNDKVLLKKILKYAIVTAIVLAVLVYLGVFYNSKNIIHLFNNEQNPQISQIAKRGLNIYFMGFFFAGINICMAMYLTATEQARNAFIISILRGCLIIVPMVLLLSSWWKMTGVWLSFVFTEFFVTIVVSFIWLLKSDLAIKLQFENSR